MTTGAISEYIKAFMNEPLKAVFLLVILLIALATMPGVGSWWWLQNNETRFQALHERVIKLEQEAIQVQRETLNRIETAAGHRRDIERTVDRNTAIVQEHERRLNQLENIWRRSEMP